MITLAIVAAGLIVVVVAILKFDVHPVLALPLATAIVMFLTPPETRLEVKRQLWVADQMKTVPLAEQTNEKRTELLQNPPAASDQTLGRRLGDMLSSTAGKLALPIIFASVIGACLMNSGAATVVADRIVKLAGMQRLPPALTATSFVLSIPIYFDSVFYLLLPLANASSRRTAKPYLLLVLAVVVGGVMAHSLVPPTPGPLLVAEQLSVPIAKMIIGGVVVGSLTSTVGLMYAFWISQRVVLDLPTSDIVSESDRRDFAGHAPTLTWSLLPILLPLCLLLSSSFAVNAEGPLRQILVACGDYTIVLGFAAALAMILLHRYRSRGQTDEEVRSIIARAISSGGVIVLLTSVGGAFGASLRDAGVGLLLQEMIAGSLSDRGIGTAVLPLAFAVTVFMRAAQGSATVSMLTAAAIVGPMVQTGLAFDPLYLALAIGCGSKPLAWMNDSGFWLVGKMSGMSVKQTLQTFTVVLSLMGVVGFIAVWLAATLCPHLPG